MKHLKKYKAFESTTTSNHKYTIVKFKYFDVYKETYSIEYCLIDKSDFVKQIPPHSIIYSYDEEMIAISDSKNIQENNGYEYIVIAATNNREYSYSLPKIDKTEVEKIIGNKDEIEISDNDPIVLNLIK